LWQFISQKSPHTASPTSFPPVLSRNTGISGEITGISLAQQTQREPHLVPEIYRWRDAGAGEPLEYAVLVKAA
jgi:hypothetical protein